MTPTAVIELGRQAIEVTLMVSAPLFLAALATGLRDPGGVHALIYQAGPQALILPIGILFVRSKFTPSAADPIRFSREWVILAGLLLAASMIWLGPGIA